MITLTLQELDLATPALRKISQTNLSARVAFQLIKILSKADTELKNLETARVQLFEKYGQRDETGRIQIKDNNVVIDKNCTDAFEKQSNELMSTEITLEVDPIDIELISNVNLTPTDALSIVKFVKLGE